MTTKLTIEATSHRVLLQRQRAENVVDHKEIIEKQTTETVWLQPGSQVSFAEVSDDYQIGEKVADGGDMAATQDDLLA